LDNIQLIKTLLVNLTFGNLPLVNVVLANLPLVFPDKSYKDNQTPNTQKIENPNPDINLWVFLCVYCDLCLSVSKKKLAV